MESDLLKKVQRSEKAIIMVASVFVFCAVFYYTFFLSKNAGEENAAAGETSAAEDSYQEYRDYISDTNKGIKNLLEGEQLKQIKLYEPSAGETNFEFRNNPFAKTF